MSRAAKRAQDATVREIDERNADVLRDPPEIPTEVRAAYERHARVEALYQACKIRIIERYPPLWPPEVVGASIAEQWMQNVMRAYAQARAADVHARAAAAGIALPA